MTSSVRLGGGHARAMHTYSREVTMAGLQLDQVRKVYGNGQVEVHGATF